MSGRADMSVLFMTAAALRNQRGYGLGVVALALLMLSSCAGALLAIGQALSIRSAEDCDMVHLAGGIYACQDDLQMVLWLSLSLVLFASACAAGWGIWKLGEKVFDEEIPSTALSRLLERGRLSRTWRARLLSLLQDGVVTPRRVLEQQRAMRMAEQGHRAEEERVKLLRKLEQAVSWDTRPDWGAGWVQGERFRRGQWSSGSGMFLKRGADCRAGAALVPGPMLGTTLAIVVRIREHAGCGLQCADESGVRHASGSTSEVGLRSDGASSNTVAQVAEKVAKQVELLQRPGAAVQGVTNVAQHDLMQKGTDR